MICLICANEFKNRQALAYHLNSFHKISTNEYKIQYKPDKDDNLLECPICGRYNMKQLTQHITDIHKLTKDEFLTQYPNTKLWIDEISERCSKAQSKGIQTFRNNLAKDPHYYDDMYDRRSAKRNYEEIATKTKQTRIERGSNYKASIRTKELWQNIEYRKKQSDGVKRRQQMGYPVDSYRNRGKKNFPITINGVNYNMRSSWEVTLAKYLNSKNIEFLYEPFAIKYTYNNVIKITNVVPFLFCFELNHGLILLCFSPGYKSSSLTS